MEPMDMIETVRHNFGKEHREHFVEMRDPKACVDKIQISAHRTSVA